MEEEYTNGKLEEIKKEELQEEETKVFVQGVDKFKSDDVVDVKETPDDGDDSSSSSSSSDEESLDPPPDEKSVVNLEKLEDEEEGFDSVVNSVEPMVPLPEELIPNTEVLVENIDVTDGTELEAKEMKEQTAPSFDENNEFSPAVVEAVSEETVETLLSADGNVGESSDIVNLASKENGDSELQLDENSKNSSALVELESGENVDNVMQKPADVVPSVDTDKVVERNTEVEIPESMLNQPIISLAPSARQMTSWRSCCGLFDVLRRSDR